jgi:hypothetical protein
MERAIDDGNGRSSTGSVSKTHYDRKGQAMKTTKEDNQWRQALTKGGGDSDILTSTEWRQLQRNHIIHHDDTTGTRMKFNFKDASFTGCQNQVID